MANTGERREITRRVNAKQAETVRQSKKLLSNTRPLSASMEVKMTKGRSRERGSADMRWASSGPGPTLPVPQGQRTDEEASSRMYDEGCPNEGTSTIPARRDARNRGRLLPVSRLS
jgi:hypothetical protein